MKSSPSSKGVYPVRNSAIGENKIEIFGNKHRDYKTSKVRKKKISNGVTLVELLVAVALLSLLMVAFYTVFKGGTKAYQTGEERVELIQNARIALDMMASQIRQALPENASAKPPIVFTIEGTGDPKSGPRIRFSAPIDSTAGAEEITFYASDYTLYKKVDNPPYQTDEGEYSDPGVYSNPVTAALPGTEGIVTDLLFEDRPPASRPGMVRITLTIKADPTDASDPGTTLHAIVKAGAYYGIDLTGGF